MGKREPRVDADAVSAWMALVEARSAVEEALEGELQADLALPLAWYEVLVRLADSPEGRLRMQDLARSVLLSKSGITRLVDKMERAGLVERGDCLSDRRVIYGVITDHGRGALERAIPVFLRGFERSFGRFVSPVEARALNSVLGKVLAGNGRTLDTCPSAYRRASKEPLVG